jgi:hypothetical protein
MCFQIVAGNRLKYRTLIVSQTGETVNTHKTFAKNAKTVIFNLFIFNMLQDEGFRNFRESPFRRKEAHDLRKLKSFRIYEMP